MLKYIILITGLVSTSIAQAGMEFSPTLSVFKTDDQQSSSQIELRLGHTWDFGLYVGGFYSLSSDKFIEHVDQYFLGPQIGYTKYNAYVLVGYTLTGESDLASGGIKYSRPMGFQVSLGYRLELAQDVFLGPEFTWRTVEYKSREVQGIPQGDTGREDTTVLPSISLQFKF